MTKTMRTMFLYLLTGALIGSSLATCLSGCGGSSSDSVDVPGAEPEAAFAIIAPASHSTVMGNLVELQGVGLRNLRSLSVEVLTDAWYAQAGELHVSDNNSWSYYPVYLEGQGAFNNHSIRVTLTHTDGTLETFRITGITRGP